jgi:hypothetical protein
MPSRACDFIGPAEFSLWAIVQARSLSSASVGRFPRLQYPLSRATSQGLWQKRASNAALPPGPFRVVLAQYGPLGSGLRKAPPGLSREIASNGRGRDEEDAPAQQLDLSSLVPFLRRQAGVDSSGGSSSHNPAEFSRFGVGDSQGSREKFITD